ncbi:ABC transporter permease [Agriterribacter sp.]|uniref:ABC transporter permease n=1 Tax=Agriterribacter sp. TaxID=2821509 RepID=UPI002BF4CE28|nr:ABC transporter permease [Agriterribacter sp.]HRP54585.1 ABC transporter permease [Agriterribacter sp.]
MFTDYFKIAIRNLIRNKSFAIINIAGLGISIAACILIGLFVYNEISFDDHVPDNDNIFRLNEYVHYDGTAPQVSAAIDPPIAPFLKNNHQEIESYTRILPAIPFIYPSIILEYAGKKITISNAVVTDSTFLGMFNPPIVEGDKNNFVRNQNTITLTQSTASKFFGNESALNKTLVLHSGDTSLYVVVDNIIADFPETSHIRAEVLLPVPHDFEESFLGTNYGAMIGPAYIKLKPGINIAALESGLTETIHSKNKFIDIRLQPLKQVHAQSTDISNDLFNYNKIDGTYIKIFILIGIAIFIIACTNFVNLTIAISGYRRKGIAIKKIIGAKRIHIVSQMLTETFISVFSALLIAIFLAVIFLPFLNNIMQRALEVATLFQSNLVAMYILVLFITTILGGAYPAWLISSAKANEILKSKILMNRSRITFRNILVTGQLVIAVIFIISTIVFMQQLSFLQNKDLGYSYSQILKVPLSMQNAAKFPVIRSELLQIKGVSDIATGYTELGGTGSLFEVDYTAPDGQQKHVSVNFENVTANYAGFFGMKIISGTDFSENNNATQYIINEKLAKHIGYSDPVGKPINLSGGWPQGIIVGVIKDFNYSSMHSRIEPLLIGSINNPVFKKQLYIKLSASKMSKVIKDIESGLRSVSGDPNISIQFLDEHFKEVYQSDRQAATMITIIGGLSITLAFLGLLGLAAFIIVKRTKEIGIRKVAGATTQNIAFMLSKDFMKLISIAMLIASPVSWWAMNTWLQGFAYRISIGLNVFLIAGASITILTLMVISFQTIKAAMANPVKALRSE